MEDRIKKALNELDSATVIDMPLTSKRSQHHSSNSESSTSTTTTTTTSDGTTTTESTQPEHQKQHRPWSSDDYHRRVTSFSIGRWFAKPSLIDPLQCARFGWINCDVDMLECVSCSKRLYYSVPAALGQAMREKRTAEFAVSVRSDGHRDTCAWRDNGCPAFYARLINIPSQIQIENYHRRAQSVYEHIKSVALPELNLEFWDAIQKKEKKKDLIKLLSAFTEFTTRSHSNSHSLTMPSLTTTTTQTPTPTSNIDWAHRKTAVILALCGWEADLGDGNGSHTVNIQCSYCQRVCGLWNFATAKNNNNTTTATTLIKQSTISHLAGGANNINDIHTQLQSQPTTVNLKRPREDDVEEKRSIRLSAMLSRSLSSSRSQMDLNNMFNNTNNKGSSAEPVKKAARVDVGWSWATKFVHHPTPSLSKGIESIQASSNPLSPLNEHRWFCPWINFSKDEIVDSAETSSSASSSSSSSTVVAATKSQSQPQRATDGVPGWENLLQLLLHQLSAEQKSIHSVTGTLRMLMPHSDSQAVIGGIASGSSIPPSTSTSTAINTNNNNNNNNNNATAITTNTSTTLLP
ncbi:hypothetical protein SAMD00019534_057470 [Acytostelium subglobosum LB1]|uniref:hypothetical protein n=1 Tax=Acytostelium subglobosum LB1 TaxID=1410327 RepID=UPI000644B3A7|nr:hypothetical protein SAMD00019534_057470 [Acytostelium subglobosum LB1]GAM22572.1 hypothetical protein SAMD00019534_057470 [Acytostelium subglobosum LB1]|eukprot:XP_012754692.1 hypothetical protein SAMD00019534_057470 [Acytostelium subglobosum LB1]